VLFDEKQLMYRKGFFITMILLIAGSFFEYAAAQKPSQRDTIPLSVYINGHDTIPWTMLPEISVYDKWPRRLKKRQEAYNRLRNAVYVTYPYARIASSVLKDVDAHLAAMPDKKQQKAYLKQKEAELKSRFGGKLEDLSVYQGKVLIKLIDRQTGTNCYDIIKEMKGGFSARLWQTVAFVFGSNLKSVYDKQEDADIENIVQEIESNPYYYYRFSNL